MGLLWETVKYRFGTAKVQHPIECLSDNGHCYTARETVEFERHLEVRDSRFCFINEEHYSQINYGSWVSNN